VRRREFITLLGGAAAWPLAAHAQQPSIGFLSSGSQESDTFRLIPFRQGLREAGYIEGQNVAVEYRWAEGQYDRLSQLAIDLVRRSVAVIATASLPAALAAKAATSTIPIVFDTGFDPIEAGLVASLNRPGGNVTGVNRLIAKLAAKQLQLLHELVPQVTTIALLRNPKNATIAESVTKDLQTAAHTFGLQLQPVNASTENDIDTAFATLVQLHAGALVIAADGLFFSRRNQLVALAARHRVPTMYQWRAATAAGGLVSYGTNQADSNRQLGIYAGRILKGEKPADLPVIQSTKFEFVINLKTAKTLGIEIPPTLLALTDEVIE
jgi:putative ABC transport system substrate-binding protein